MCYLGGVVRVLCVVFQVVVGSGVCVVFSSCMGEGVYMCVFVHVRLFWFNV